MDDAWAAEIGRRIELARKRAKLSRPELADVLEVHTNTITGYERGDRAAYKVVSRLADATNADLRWLMFGATYQDPLEQIGLRLSRIEEALAIPRLATAGEAETEEELAAAHEQELDDAVAQDAELGASNASGAPAARRRRKAR